MPKQSAWNDHIQRRVQRRKMVREFARQQGILINAFHNVAQFTIAGRVENVARTATDRIIAEGNKRLEDKANQIKAGSVLDKIV